MYTLINRTTCHVHPQLLLDAHGEEHLLVVAKASFTLQADRLVATEAEVILADRYRRLELTWRASVSVHERLDDFEWVRVEATGAPHA